MQAAELPILYSFRRCPYAMRARMSLVSSGISCQLREVVLRDKPRELIAVSPKATVPVLVLEDGRVLEESFDIMQWALQRNDPEQWLKPTDAPIDTAHELIALTESALKPHLDRYKYPNRYPGADPLEHRSKACEFVEQLEDRLQAKRFLLGNQACIADMAIFPFVRQFVNTDNEWFATTPYGRVREWLQSLIGGRHFIAAMQKFPQWHSGDEPTLFP